MKKVQRSADERVIAGVCGGVAEYFKIDPVIVRLVWVVLAFIGGSGIVAYILAFLALPDGAEPDKPPIYKRISKSGSPWILIVVGIALIALFQFNHSFLAVAGTIVGAGFKIFFIALIIIAGIYLLSRGQKTPFSFFQINKTGDFRLSDSNKLIAGVCGGIAETLNIDPTVIRLGFTIGSIVTAGFGLMVYILLAILLPHD